MEHVCKNEHTLDNPGSLNCSYEISDHQIQRNSIRTNRFLSFNSADTNDDMNYWPLDNQA